MDLAADAVHRALWLAGRVSLRNGRPRSLPPASARYLTTVVRVPAGVAAALEPALDRLRRLEPAHYYYPADTLHVTLANLDGLGAPLARVEASIARHPPLALEAVGLGLSPGTVLVRVRPLGAGFLELRSELRALTEWGPGTRAAAVRLAVGRIAFANVVRFAGPVGLAYLDELARLRRLELGRWSATHVDLVETDRLLSPGATRVLARIPLAGGA